MKLKFLLLVALAIVLALTVTIWLYPSSGDFRSDNPFWNGLSRFTREFPATPLSSLSSLPSEPKGTSLVLVPYLPLTENDQKILQDYVSSGGTLILMDDYGYGNDLLEYLGLETKFSGKSLLDPLFNYRNKWFPQVTDFASVPAASGVKSLLLNHATSLEEVPDAEVVAWSSPFSFLDVNGNSVWDKDEGEPTGPLPVAAQLPRGEGWLFLVADSSILINSMEERGDNLLFIQNIVRVSGAPGQVFLDQSHLPGQALDTAKEALETVRHPLATPLGVLGVIVIIVALTLGFRKGERP